MASTIGPGTGVVGGAAAIGAGTDAATTLDAPDAKTANDAATAKANNLKFSNQQNLTTNENIKTGRTAEQDRLNLLGGGSTGVSSLAGTDGVEAPGVQALHTIFSAPSTSLTTTTEPSGKQALEAFQPLVGLLGKPAAGTNESALDLGKGSWPLTPLPSQADLLTITSAPTFTALANPATASPGTNAPANVAGASTARARTTTESSGASTAPTAGKPDPQIVARVQFVQRLSALVSKTFTEQLNDPTGNGAAARIGASSVGILQPFAEQFPALHTALKAAFAGTATGEAGGNEEVTIPPLALSQVESALGKAFGKATAFVKDVKANSTAVVAVLQKYNQGDTAALQNAPAHIRTLVQGVMSWNQSNGHGSFPNSGGVPGEASGAQVTGEASGNSQTGSVSAESSGNSTTIGVDDAQPLGGLNFAAMDIDALIFMVMSEGATEQTDELRDSLAAMQKNTLAKQAQRQKHEALESAQASMKSSMDNDYYNLIQLGPDNGGILQPPQGPTQTQFENGCVINWGDGQCDDTTGTYSGPAPYYQLPDPQSATWKQWTTPPPPPGTPPTASQAGGLGGAAYGLTDEQYNYLGEYFAQLQKTDPDDYKNMDLDTFLQASTSDTPAGAGLTVPLTTAQDGIDNLTAAGKLTAGAMPKGPASADPGTDLDSVLNDPGTKADIDAILGSDGELSSNATDAERLAAAKQDPLKTEIDALLTAQGLLSAPSQVWEGGQYVTVPGKTPTDAQILAATNDPSVKADVDTALIKAGYVDDSKIPPEKKIEALAELVAMEQAILPTASGNALEKLQAKLAADTASLTKALADVQNGALKTADGKPDTAATAKLNAFLNVATAPSLASFMSDFTTSVNNVANQLNKLSGSPGNAGFTGGSVSVDQNNVYFDATKNQGHVQGQASYSSDRDDNDSDLNDHDTGGSVNVYTSSGPELPSDASSMLNLIAGDTGWDPSKLTTSDLSNLGKASSSLPAGVTFTAPDSGSGGPNLDKDYATAFNGSTGTAQSDFLSNLPNNLPVNANGQPYDPGSAGYVGADGKKHKLTADQEAILQQLVGSGSITLGETPDQLAKDANAASIVNSINAGQVPPDAAAGTYNETGGFALFGTAVSKAKDDLDSLGDLSTDLQMSIQLEQSQYSQIMEALSNVMKKMSDTGQAIVENMK